MTIKLSYWIDYQAPFVRHGFWYSHIVMPMPETRYADMLREQVAQLLEAEILRLTKPDASVFNWLTA
jgi:hypothetical protein